MAEVRLGRYEVEQVGLPAVCVKCGAPSTVERRKQFTWYPKWVILLILGGLLPYLIALALTIKRMTIVVPFCDEHKNHWRWRYHVMGWSLALLFLLGGAGLYFANHLGPAQKPFAEQIKGLLCFGMLGLGLFWLIGVVILQNTAIRPKEITDRSITLKG